MSFIIVLLLLVSIGLQLTGGKFMLPDRGRRKLVLDSCALIDGRIVEMAKAGFIADQLVVPKFILAELQFLADGNDSHKRERARFGLDIARELQDTLPTGQVTIDPTLFPSLNTTDDKLVVLAKKLNASLYTTDFNLNKVANVEGVHVLNVNELAQQLRPVALPGETHAVKVVQKGSNPSQGVGYLDDGTMVVVDHAAELIGKTVPITVERMHQTAAGKMVFAHVQRDTVKHIPQAATNSKPSAPTLLEQPSATTRPSLDSATTAPATSSLGHRRRNRRQPRQAEGSSVLQSRLRRVGTHLPSSNKTML